jgi:hypothetical protein
MMPGLDHLIDVFAAKGDMGHLALLLWAGTATLMAGYVLKALEAANRRFDSFVRELSRFNERFDDAQAGDANEQKTEIRQNAAGAARAGNGHG